MSWTNPRTWTTSELVTAAIMNAHIRDNLNAIWKGTTAGDLDYYTSSTAKTRLAIGTTGQVLQVAGGVPTWATLSNELVLFQTPVFHASYYNQTVSVGTYSIAANTFHASIPNTARGILARVSAKWSSNAGDAYYCNITRYDSGVNGLLVRSIVANIISDGGPSIVPLDVDGKFDITVGGASALLYVTVWGYVV